MDQVRRDFCATGITTTYNPSHFGEHGATYFIAAGDVRRSIAERFAGKPVTANC